MDFINNKLFADVEGTCTGRYGYIIAVLSISDPGSGTVLPGVGTAEFVVKYTAIVYKPFKGEVVDGQVASVNKMGFFADVGPLQVFVSSHLIPQDIKFDPGANPPCFSSEDQVIEKGSKVRLKIVGTRVDATEIFAIAWAARYVFSVLQLRGADLESVAARARVMVQLLLLIEAAILDFNLVVTSMSSPIKKKSKPSQQPVSHTSVYKTQSNLVDNEHAQLPTDNLAELSLGQRLKASAEKGADNDNEESFDGADADAQANAPTMPAQSLATLLTQSLNSNDKNLLESCLGQTDLTIIRNSVNRLPSQLAIPLLNQCTTRLAKPGRAGPKRAKALLEWSKAVLTIHTAYLLSVPQITQKLLGLHSALSQRINSHEQLMSLSGRLDVVLSQIALQRSIQEERRAAEQGKDKSNNAVTYVEGDSDEEDNIEYDNDDGEGIEDVELGNGQDDSEDDSDADEEDDDEGLDNSLDGDDSDRNAMVEDEAIEEDDDSDDDEEDN
ncbi:hypothetical protein E3P99_02555 [Wallemia hederae]|uniref:S1 motif domain-containing protein n=1 Tax=Wallemia hederae TaxID=1540922 RepID=A0A4T0FM31_9BASI|nr:hypothetical protein E3P99_02555 [Wallemia hederae]